jgi:L-lactate utilization protein LutC
MCVVIFEYMNYKKAPSESIINKTVESLNRRGFNAIVVSTKDEAREAALSMIAEGSEVMTMTSKTLEEVGIAEAINSGSEYVSLKNKLVSMDRTKESREMQEIGAAPAVAVGSVHGVTEDGQIIIASATGSQLPAYAYGADKVIWVVGAQKISKTLDTAMQRLNEYVLPLESERARIAYGVEGSNVSKLLIMNNEFTPNRIHVILVKEPLGF